MKFSAPAVPFYSNVLGAVRTDFSDMPKALANTSSLRYAFTDELAAMQAAGIDIFVEFGPKSVLTGLVKKTLKGVTAKNVENCDTGRSAGIMEQYTLIGHPLGHSMSPFIHERLFAMAGREASYTLTDIAPEHLEGKEPFLRSLQGFNITIPHKMAIIPMVDELDESAKRYNSVNCVANQNGKLVGYNTDCDGFTMSVKEYPMDGKVLLIGCGGVGRMIATEALRHGANLTIGIIPQDKELVEEFIREAKQTMPDAKVQYAVTADIHDKFDVIINASPVGMFPKVDACPVSDELIDGADYFFDVIYNPTKTLFLRKALEKGKVAKGGAAMLVLRQSVPTRSGTATAIPTSRSNPLSVTWKNALTNRTRQSEAAYDDFSLRLYGLRQDHSGRDPGEKAGAAADRHRRLYRRTGRQVHPGHFRPGRRTVFPEERG